MSQVGGMPEATRSAGSRHERGFAGLPFVWAAIIAGLVGGFGLGGALALALALGLPIGAWWLAAVQAHGRAQLVGWAGLMVLGVGLHVLPRLRGAPLVRPQSTRWALALLATGLGLRVVGQPLGAAPGAPAWLGWVSLALAGLLMAAGAAVALALLLATHRAGPPIVDYGGFGQIKPLLVTGLAVLEGALLFDAGLGIVTAAAAAPVLPPAASVAVTILLLQGFLTPVSLAMSARFLPLYLGLRPAPAPALRLALGLLLVGLTARLADPALVPLGGIATGLGLLAGIWAVGQRVVTPPGTPPRQSPVEWLPTGLWRPQPPPAGRGRPVTSGQRAARLLIRCAYAWLLVAALLALSAAGPAPPTGDLEVHALGAGFVTLLILGVGGLILPGLLGGTAPDPPLVAALALGNVAVVLRVLPGLAGWLAPGLLPVAVVPGVMALAGLAGAGAVACLALVVRGATGRSLRA
jgi:uncharacterized protein involved in response to NO